MSLLDRLRRREAPASAVYRRLGPEQVTPAASDITLEPGLHYLRIVLVQMSVRSTVWRTMYPIMRSKVRLQFGDERLELPFVADSTAIGGGTAAEGVIAARNFELTPPLPFRGGSVALDVGLVGVPGRDGLGDVVKVLLELAGAVAVPQVSAILPVLGPVAGAIDKLAGRGAQRLGVTDTFDERSLRAGHLVAIATSEDELARPLWVVNDELREGASAAESRPFERADFVVVRLDAFTDRKDWPAITAIAAPWDEARAAISRREVPRARFYLQAAQEQALLSPDLTEAHRTLVFESLRRQFDAQVERVGVGLMPEEVPRLADLMESAGSAEAALARGVPALAELFASAQ